MGLEIIMIKQGKIWGNTISIFSKNNVEIHRIEAKEGFMCSKHKHEHKFNAFFIEKGKLKIQVWKKDYPLIDQTIISDGEMTVVKPGEFNFFYAIEDTVAYEIYWVEIQSDDITREDCGKFVNEKEING
jgi:mannose-6-phosphate isomerase-like protein (cupin superfamily)